MSDSSEPSGAAATNGGAAMAASAPAQSAMTIAPPRIADRAEQHEVAEVLPRRRVGGALAQARPDARARQRAVRVGDRRPQHERRALPLAVGAPAPDRASRGRGSGCPTITTEVPTPTLMSVASAIDPGEAEPAARGQVDEVRPGLGGAGAAAARRCGDGGGHGTTVGQAPRPGQPAGHRLGGGDAPTRRRRARCARPRCPPAGRRPRATTARRAPGSTRWRPRPRARPRG